MAGNWSDSGRWYLEESATITVADWNYIVDRLILKGLMTMDDRVDAYPEPEEQEEEQEKEFDTSAKIDSAYEELIQQSQFEGETPTETAKRLVEEANAASELASPAEQAGLASKLAWVEKDSKKDRIIEEKVQRHGPDKVYRPGITGTPEMQTSPLETFVKGVVESVHNLDVYAAIKWQPSTFKVDFLASLRLEGGIITAHHETSFISRGATYEQISREVEIARSALVLDVAQRAFVNDTILIQHALIPRFAKPEYTQ